MDSIDANTRIFSGDSYTAHRQIYIADSAGNYRRFLHPNLLEDVESSSVGYRELVFHRKKYIS